MGSLFSREPAFSPTTHEPGFFHNMKLNESSIKELRSLRLKLKITYVERHLTDDQITAELAPLVAEIAKRESAVVVQ